MFVWIVLLLLNALPFPFEPLADQVVLVHFYWSELISLSLEEVTYQQYDGHVLLHSNHLGFSWAYSVSSLSFRWALNHIFSKWCVGASVTCGVVINGKCRVDEQIILVQIRSLNYQAQELSSADVPVHPDQLLVIITIACVFFDSLS